MIQPGAWPPLTFPSQSGPSTGSLCRASTPAQEQPVEIGQRQTHPGGTAMVALVGALRALHFTQQCVHLGQAENASGADRRVAGRRCKQVIDRLLDAARMTLLR